MWDKNAPLQLLQSMPKKLSKENLEKLQLVIDADKYKNSLISGFDLCGMYAPFCRGCKKTSIYPCALAYINMMRAEGMDIEIDAKPVVDIQGVKFHQEESAKTNIEEQAEVEKQTIEEIAVTQSDADNQVENTEILEETDNTEQIEEQEQETVAEEVPETVVKDVSETVDTNCESPKIQEKKKIRIAVARRKL